MGCIKASDYEELTGGSGVILGTYSGVNASGDCVEDCGLCCVPTCPSDLTTYVITPEYDENDPTTWCSYQTLIPLGGPILWSEDLYNYTNMLDGCSVNGNDYLAHYPPPQVSADSMYITEATPIGSNLLYIQTFCDPNVPAELQSSYDDLTIFKNYSLTKSVAATPGAGNSIYNPGYPSGTYFIEVIETICNLSIGNSIYNGFLTATGYGIDDLCSTEIQQSDQSFHIYVDYYKYSKKYFQCIDGVLIDKTSEALVSSPRNIERIASVDTYFYGYGDTIGCGPPVNVGTNLSFEQYGTYIESSCDESSDGGICGSRVYDSTDFGFQQGFWGECGQWIDDETRWQFPDCNQYEGDNFYAICVDDPRYEEIYAPYTFATDPNIGVVESPFKPGLYWPATAKCGGPPYAIWTQVIGTEPFAGAPVEVPECGKAFYPSLSEVGTEGITSLGFTCNDTISKSGCISGGVLTPTGVPLGTWFTGLDCEIANSGYGGCSGLMNM